MSLCHGRPRGGRAFAVSWLMVTGLACQGPSSGGAYEEIGASAGLVLADRDELGLGGFGVAVGDLNGDGFLDIILPGAGEEFGAVVSRVFMGAPDGIYVDDTDAWNLPPPPASEDDSALVGLTLADFDNDGDPDAFLANDGTNQLLRNDGDTFVDVTAQAGLGGAGDVRTTHVSVADFDRDGWLDAYFVNNQFADSASSEAGLAPADGLYRSNGDGTFTDVSDLLSWPRHGAGFSAVWTDVDADGDADLYVVNDHGGWIQPNQLFRNDSAAGGLEFTNISETCGCDLAMGGMGIAVGDYDRDGLLDWYLTNILESGTEKLLRAVGGGLYVDTTLEATAVAIEEGSREVGWGTDFLDYDNDGWLDLAVAYQGSKTEDVPSPNALLRNDSGAFSVVVDSGMNLDEAMSEGLVVYDLDADGCQDVLVQNTDGPPELYRNRCDWPGHWLGLRLQGTASNRDAVGAWVEVSTDQLVQVAEVSAGSSSVHSSRPRRLHFGLGLAESANVRIHWPAGGVQEAVYDAGQTVVVIED